MPFKTTWCAIAAGLVLALVSGCEFKGDRVNGGVADGARWPFVPVSVRIHPFTTIRAAEGDEPITLEARIEMLDAAGDVTKGVGELRFELYAEAGTAQGAGKSRQLMRWDASLLTMEQNQRHYDSITRTYSFKLKLAERPPRDMKLRLDVQLTDDVGRRMSDSAPVSQPKRPDPEDS